MIPPKIDNLLADIIDSQILLTVTSWKSVFRRSKNRIVKRLFCIKHINENQYCVVTNCVETKLTNEKFLSTVYDFSSLSPLLYFQLIYMIVREILVIRMSFHWCLLWNKRSSQLIMKLHARKARGRYVLKYDFINKTFHPTYFVILHHFQKGTRFIINVKLWGGETVNGNFLRNILT